MDNRNLNTRRERGGSLSAYSTEMIKGLAKKTKKKGDSNCLLIIYI